LAGHDPASGPGQAVSENRCTLFGIALQRKLAIQSGGHEIARGRIPDYQIAGTSGDHGCADSG